MGPWGPERCSAASKRSAASSRLPSASEIRPSRPGRHVAGIAAADFLRKRQSSQREHFTLARPAGEPLELPEHREVEGDPNAVVEPLGEDEAFLQQGDRPVDVMLDRGDARKPAQGAVDRALISGLASDREALLEQRPCVGRIAAI